MEGITLIGMSGSGKSAIGSCLSKRLDRRFVDIDALILEKEGRTHTAILEERGGESLRRLEERITLEIDLADTVLSPPGSIINSPSAMEKICRESRVVYLHADPNTIMARVGDSIHTRGIIGLKEKGLATLMRERSILYRHYADYIINTSEQTKEEMGMRIQSMLAMCDVPRTFDLKRG